MGRECSITTLAHGPALLMRQEEISFSFAQAPSLTPPPSVSPASLKMDPSPQTVGVGMGVGVFGPGGIPGPVLDNCLTVSETSSSDSAIVAPVSGRAVM